MSNMLTTGEAASILGVTRQTVNNIIKRGELRPVATIGTRGDQLLDADEVLAFAEARAA